MSASPAVVAEEGRFSGVGGAWRSGGRTSCVRNAPIESHLGATGSWWLGDSVVEGDVVVVSAGVSLGGKGRPGTGSHVVVFQNLR